MSIYMFFLSLKKAIWAKSKKLVTSGPWDYFVHGFAALLRDEEQDSLLKWSIDSYKLMFKDRFNEHRRTVDNPSNISKPTAV